jgi:putative endonuclease
MFRLLDGVRHRSRRRTMSPDHLTGRRGEDLAHRYLQDQGLVVIGRNYRARSGMAELDIIARDGETLVFVEVKTRATEEFGTPDRAIDEEKRIRLFRGAREYARRAGVDWQKVRFDNIGIVLSAPPTYSHFRDVFPLAVQ